MIKLIFIHGIADQTTDYSMGLWHRIEKQLFKQLAPLPLTATVSTDEIMYAQLSTSMFELYDQLGYQQPKWFWGKLTRKVDPLVLEMIKYLSDPKGTIQQTVKEQLDNITRTMEDENNKIIIVAHSLGSVIAVDYLNKSSFSCNGKPLLYELITMGSPIPLFSVAGKGSLLCDIGKLMLSGKLSKWVNIVSRRDGIGRIVQPFLNYSSNKNRVSFDEHFVSTGFLPIKAHIGYWKSKQVATIIASEVIRVEEQQANTIRRSIRKPKLKAND